MIRIREDGILRKGNSVTHQGERYLTALVFEDQLLSEERCAILKSVGEKEYSVVPILIDSAQRLFFAGWRDIPLLLADERLLKAHGHDFIGEEVSAAVVL